MTRKIFIFLIFALILTFLSSVFVRVDIGERAYENNNDTGVDKQDIYRISIYKIPGGENLRGFPFVMFSTPYTHNSKAVPEVNILLNIIFYFISIFGILKFYKSLRIGLKK